MPQIEQLATTYSSQIFWLLVFFGLTFFVIGRLMVPKVMDTVELRDRQIADDLAAAQAARDKADSEEEAWRKRENENRAAAQAVIADAKAEAARKNEARVKAAQAKIDEQLAQAEADIATARRSALTEIEQVATDATQDIVARLAGIEVPAARAQGAVKEVMAHG